MSTKKDTKTFIKESKEKFPDRYHYDKTIYIDAHTKLIVTCKLHGDITITPNYHFSSGQGCNECKRENKQYKFVTKAKEVHGDKYSYELVEYKGSLSKVKIICPDHGVFEQRIDSHLNGNGCPICFKLRVKHGVLSKLSIDDRAYIDNMELMCLCYYCGKAFKPSKQSIRSRLLSLDGRLGGECRIYCSDSCKYECSTYNQKKYPKSYKQSTGRKAQPQLRKMVFERDGHTCQRCGHTDNLHCHHITGVELNPVESADIDNCITLCKGCHKYVHSQDGCTHQDYKRKMCL